MGWYRREAAAVVITVRLTPKADRDALGPVRALAEDREVLQVRVRALPADGAANGALIKLIAATLGLPKSSVEIVTGRSQRVKQVRITGDANGLVPRIRALPEK